MERRDQAGAPVDRRTSHLEFDERGFSERLSFLISANLESDSEAKRFRSPEVRAEFEAMRSPVAFGRALALFGLLIGSFVPLSIFLKIMVETPLDGWMFGVLLIVNLIAAIVGYFSGPVVARVLERAGELGSFQMAVAVPFVGMLWGAVAGALSGAIVLLIGAVVGAMVGAAVGAVALTIFTMLFGIISINGNAESSRFWPVAAGITAVLCALVLGL